MSTCPLAMVTGGSSGIGYELAAQLAERGYDVAISGQSGRVHDLAQKLEKLGVEAYPFRADAATYDGVESFDKTEVARQGIEALLAGDDHVVGGDDATKQQAIDNRATSEPEKAARQGAMARPS